MLRTALLITACAGLFTVGCSSGDPTPDQSGASAGAGGGASASSSVAASTGGGGEGGSGGAPIVLGCDATAPATTMISCVESYTPGPGGGHGEDQLPAIISGPPLGGGAKGGSTDVLSLGTDGEIVVGFGGNAVVDGEGPDFIVFENAFWAGGNPLYPFKELGRISVSEDGATWTAFPCKQDALPYDGCAGWHPVYSSPSNTISPTDPAAAGGDVFDLATIGVKKARFLKIVDLHNTTGTDGTTGFDLDAVAVIHAEALASK
jgi:hypothetical protein